jgi:hypothetical protein
VKAVSGIRLLCGLAVLFFISPGIGAQDYWFEEDSEDSSGPGISIGNLGLKMGGEITGELLIFPHDLGGGRAGGAEWGELVNAKLNFDASSPHAEAALHFNLSPRSIQDLGEASSGLLQTPLLIDELYVRAFLGPLTLETGLRKLAWGRADVQGPLDVTNPLDYTDLTNVGDTMGRKIARPMIHASLPLGSFSKLEGVFIPSFQGHRYVLDSEDHWYPRAITDNRRSGMIDGLVGGIIGRLPAPLNRPPYSSGIAQRIAAGMESDVSGLNPNNVPETQGLEYAQGGLRFTTTLGPMDIGAQYYSGFLFRPSFTLNGAEGLLQTITDNSAAISSAYSAGLGQLENTLEAMIGSADLGPRLKYNRYHQLGADYTQVLFDFSVRAEAAVNITQDTKGDDGSVYNPSLAWSLGFDRDLFGFTLLVEADQAIRLLDHKVGADASLDTEAGTPLTATAITSRISRAFFQDKLEAKFALLWNIETGDVYLMPSVSYTLGDLEAELSGGIFAGKDGGELAQYRNSGYIKTALTYSF